jgi:hypothetical protein
MVAPGERAQRAQRAQPGDHVPFDSSAGFSRRRACESQFIAPLQGAEIFSYLIQGWRDCGRLPLAI